MFYFCKMQATGNDFILIDYINNKFDYSLKLLAEYLCDRHYGVGADGIIIIDKSNIADFKMRIFRTLFIEKNTGIIALRPLLYFRIHNS